MGGSARVACDEDVARPGDDRPEPCCSLVQDASPATRDEARPARCSTDVNVAETGVVCAGCPSPGRRLAVNHQQNAVPLCGDTTAARAARHRVIALLLERAPQRALRWDGIQPMRAGYCIVCPASGKMRMSNLTLVPNWRRVRIDTRRLALAWKTWREALRTSVV